MEDKEEAKVEAVAEDQEQARQARVRALLGKYASVPTSSEEFARRKEKEIEIENRRIDKD